MKINLRKKSTWIALISIVITIGLMRFAYAKLHLNYSAEDRKLASDLAALSGLPEDDVFSIRDVVDDWGTITRNIFVYKDILNRVGDNRWNRRTAFKLIGKYPADQVLTVYQYLDQNDRDISDAGDLLEKAGSESMEAILSGTVDSKLYESYRPADKEQIRQWLEEGYLPQDILNADTISMAKDMKIGEVLALKNDSDTWEDIAKKLDYQFKEETSQVSLQLPDEEAITSSDYAGLVSQANARAEVKQMRRDEAIRKQLDLSEQELADYQDRGFSLRDIQNARHLAKDAGVSMEKLLWEKNQGHSWPEMVKQQHKTGKGASE